MRFVVLDAHATTQVGDEQAKMVEAESPGDAALKVAGWRDVVVNQYGDKNCPAWLCWNPQQTEIMFVVGLVEPTWTGRWGKTV